MEKYARQHIAEGVRSADELHVDMDSEIYRALNSHYNRNNQLEVNWKKKSIFLFFNLTIVFINIVNFKRSHKVFVT